MSPGWEQASLLSLNARKKTSLPPGRVKENSTASRFWLDFSFHVLLWQDCTQGPGFNSKTFGWAKLSTMAILLGSPKQRSASGENQHVSKGNSKENNSTGAEIK